MSEWAGAGHPQVTIDEAPVETCVLHGGKSVASRCAPGSSTAPAHALAVLLPWAEIRQGALPTTLTTSSVSSAKVGAIVSLPHIC